MPAVRTNGAVFGCATKISAQVMPRMMMAVLKFSVNFQVRRNVSAPKAKRTAARSGEMEHQFLVLPCLP